MHKISKSFLCGLAVSCLSICLGNNAFALSANACHGGGQYQYCGWGRSCKSCPANCYCSPRDSASSESCTGWTGISCSGIDRRIESNSGSGISDGSFGIRLCPHDYPYSDSGANNESLCYARKSNGEKVYNKMVSCEPGQYLKAGQNNCIPCENGSVCVGGSFHTNFFDDQGIAKCAGGKIPNDTLTDCVDKNGTCPAGQYYLKETDNCTPCPTDTTQVCPGVTFNRSLTDATQGLKSCTDDQIPNSTHTACIPDDPEEKHCEPGYYATKGRLTCKPCPNAADTYCPGGDFKKSTKSDQGKLKCPFNGKANSGHISCNVTLTKDQMKYGPAVTAAQKSASNLDQQCWIRTNNHAEYKSCIMGTTNKQ